MKKVIFRKWKAYRDVIALFPDQVDGEFIGSYMHVGQHSLCHKDFVMGASVARNLERISRP